MAEPTHSIVSREQLEALAARLIEHAEHITNVAARQMEQDLRKAAKAIEEYAHKLGD